MVPAFLGGPELKSAGGAKCCRRGSEAELPGREAVHIKADFYLFFSSSLSSRDYFLCTEPAREQREPLRERRGDPAPFFLNYFSLSTSLFVLFVVAVSGELQYPAAVHVE